MAFLKYADALVQTPRLDNHKHWNSIRSAAKTVSTIEVGKIVPDFDISNYLLTHATIVASVDVEPNDFYIKPECSQYVNQNGDSWERRLLMGTYNTFIGAQNYLEHVQIPYLSKGRIIDAVAREIESKDSVYIDILVATERRHRDLVAAIENGNLNTLSMGCSIKYSVCSKCGNKAADEAELCDHIKYMKNQFFIDENGTKRIIAELCGHRSELDSNIFIEASWVANPAFKGAVLRNILLAKGQDTKDIAPRIEAAYVRKANEGSIDGYLKAASSEQLSSLEKKLQAVKQANALLQSAGLKKLGADDPFDTPAAEEEEQQHTTPEDAQAADAKLPDPFDAVQDPTPAPEEPAQAQAPAAQPEQAPAQEEQQQAEAAPAPAEGDPGPDKSQAEGEQAPQEGGEAPAPEQEQDYNGMFDEALAQNAPQDAQGEAPQQDQGEAPEQQAAPQGAPMDGGQAQGAPAPAPSTEPESMHAIIDRVKKDIRQQVIDELTEELSSFGESYDERVPDDISHSDNLVTAFIDIYKPRTGYSSAKLASIFNLLWNAEQNRDFVKLASSPADLIDLFQFIDKFQIKGTALKEAHYNLLRKVGSDDLGSLSAFIGYLQRNHVTDKDVIKSMVTKASYIREYHKRKVTNWSWRLRERN